MRIADLNFTGLWTDPNGECNGMRAESDAFAVKQRSLGHTVDTLYHSYDEHSPDTICRNVLAEIQGYDFVRIKGHSFGGALLEFFLSWLGRWHSTEKLNMLAIFFDPAPNGPLFGQWIVADQAYRDQAKRWRVPSVCGRAVSFFQWAGRPMGVKGVPFRDRDGVTNYDVTSELDANGNPVDHCSLITCDFVRARVEQVTEQAMVKVDMAVGVAK